MVCTLFIVRLALLNIIPAFAFLSDEKKKLTDALEAQAILFAVTYGIDIFEVVTQTLLLGYLLNSELELNVTGRKKQLLRFLLQFLGMSNFMAWIYGSFITPRISSTASWNLEFFTPLVHSVIEQFSLPFALFFRFFSMHIILEAYHRLWDMWGDWLSKLDCQSKFVS